jgi:hypothetical protein
VSPVAWRIHVAVVLRRDVLVEAGSGGAAADDGREGCGLELPSAEGQNVQHRYEGRVS